MQALAKRTLVKRYLIDGTNNILTAGTSAVNGTAIDLQGYGGAIFQIIVGTIAASGSVTCKLAYSSDGTTFTDCTAGGSGTTADTDDNKIIVLEITDASFRYYRVTTTRGAGGNSTIDAASVTLYGARKMDVTADATTFSTTVVIGS